MTVDLVAVFSLPAMSDDNEQRNTRMELPPLDGGAASGACSARFDSSVPMFSWKSEDGFALMFDLFVAGRILFAYVRNEKGRGWIFYVVLMYSSALWIEGVTYVVFGET